jgi:hypothetical protein
LEGTLLAGTLLAGTLLAGTLLAGTLLAVAGTLLAGTLLAVAGTLLAGTLLAVAGTETVLFGTSTASTGSGVVLGAGTWHEPVAVPMLTYKQYLFQLDPDMFGRLPGAG